MPAGRFSPLVESEDEFLVVSTAGVARHPSIVYPKLNDSSESAGEAGEEMSENAGAVSAKQCSLVVAMKEQHKKAGITSKQAMMMFAILTLVCMGTYSLWLRSRDTKVDDVRSIGGKQWELLSGYFPLQLRRMSLMVQAIDLPAIINHVRALMVAENSIPCNSERMTVKNIRKAGPELPLGWYPRALEAAQRRKLVNGALSFRRLTSLYARYCGTIPKLGQRIICEKSFGKRIAELRSKGEESLGKRIAELRHKTRVAIGDVRKLYKATSDVGKNGSRSSDQAAKHQRYTWKTTVPRSMCCPISYVASSCEICCCCCC